MTDSSSPTDLAGQTAHPINETFRAGLSLLWRASTYAQDAGVDRWDFALEIDTLYESGLTISDLRWLVSKGYVEHGQETSMYGDAHRSFRPSKGLNFTPTTCFVLTSNGDTYASTVLNVAGADK